MSGLKIVEFPVTFFTLKDSQIWRIVYIPPVVSSTEGNDVTITAKIAGPAAIRPTAIWIKGKFSELKKSARIKIDLNEEKLEASLTIKKAKIFDEGRYTLKLKSGDQEVQTAVQLNVGKQEIAMAATVNLNYARKTLKQIFAF